MIKTKDCNNVWISEPRWSWYGTPLWQTWAIKLTLIANNFENQWSTISTRDYSRMRDHFRMDDFIYTLYMTEEEYVMFKLTVKNISDISMVEIRKGIIYS